MSYIRVGAIYSISTTQYRCQPCGLLANWCALHASCTDAPHCNASRHRFTRSLNTLRSNLLRTRCSALASKRDDADPGHWEYSPEWWGTHAGGWGRDAGRTLFAQQSRYGNGEVRHCGFDTLDSSAEIRGMQAAVVRSQSLRTRPLLYLAQLSWNTSGGC